MDGRREAHKDVLVAVPRTPPPACRRRLQTLKTGKESAVTKNPNIKSQRRRQPMALISLRQLLDHAAEHGYGVPAFNVKDRKSTRLNSSHVRISYAVFCLKKKKKKEQEQ